MVMASSDRFCDPFPRYFTIFILCLPLLVQSKLFRAGRHVCIEERRVAVPREHTETYYRPVYKRQVEVCEGFKLCSTLRVVYKLAVRKVYRSEVQTKLVNSCCPGWAQFDKSSRDCLKPVCRTDCNKRGTCTGPDTCRCNTGWGGPTCETDLDECSQEMHMCQQTCLNTLGSYECGCYEGFQVAKDKTSCEICLTCNEEYRGLQADVRNLTEKVTVLEKEKKAMHKSITVIQRDYKKTLAMINDIKNRPIPTTTTVKTTAPSTNINGYYSNYDLRERIESLSEQIGILEEKLSTTCSCQYN
ncbi:epidermal growth factor-like protein 8 [Argonauta hians]